MLIVLALLWGAAAGAVIHFALPHRDTRGAALAPMLGAVIGGAAWLIMTWLGLEDTGWNWLVSLALPIAITWPAIAFLSRARLAHDERTRERLKLV